MRGRRTVMKQYLSLLLSFWLLTLTSQAAAERFELNPCTLAIPERGEVSGLVLLTEQNVFTFLPPVDWRASSDASEKKVTFLSPDQGMSIVFQLAQRNPALIPQIQPDWLRQQVLKRFPNADLIEEFECYAGDFKGRAYDLQQMIGGRKVCTRICFVSLPEGSIEFTLTAGLEKFPKQHVPFASLLGSFRTEPARPE